VSLRPHHDPPSAGLVALAYASAAHDQPARWKIGAFDVPPQIGTAETRVIDIRHRGSDRLPQIVRRDVGGHTHGDARAAVDKQIREARRQDSGLFSTLIVVRGPVDRVRFDVPQHLHGDLAQPAFCVAHGCRGITVHGTKVAVTVDQEVAD
jgi:hypothetical protein